MSIKTEDPLAYHRRKARQSDHLAMCARSDNDMSDYQRHDEASKSHRQYIDWIMIDGRCPCPAHTRA